MKKFRVCIIERFTERTLAEGRALDEAAAKKFVDDFYECFSNGPILDITALIEPVYE